MVYCRAGVGKNRLIAVTEGFSMDEVSFRNVETDDIALLEYWYSMTDRLGYATGFRNFADVKDRLLSGPVISRMIVINGSQPVGFLCFELRSLDRVKAAYIHIMMIDPLFQNRGIGTQAAEKLLKFLASHGASAVLLSVHRQNKRGLKFWESLGFRQLPAMEKMTAFSGTNEATILQKSLT